MNNPNMHETATDHNIWIEPVPNQPARWLAHIGPVILPMSAESGDRIPRTRDLDLAAWLEFKTLYDIRKLVRRMMKEGKLTGVVVVATVARTSGGRPGQEFWLTREQALLVATQSDTAKAWEVTAAMVKVFDRVIDMLRGANDTVLTEQMDALRQSVTQQGQMIEMMRQILSRLVAGPSGGVIGENLAREAIEIPVESAIETHAHSKKARRSLRRSLYNRLQSAAQFTGKDCEWKNLPVSQLARAQRALSGMLKEVPDRAAKLDAKYGALGPLFDRRKKRHARKVTPKTST